MAAPPIYFIPPLSMTIDLATLAYHSLKNKFSKKLTLDIDWEPEKKEVSALIPAYNEGERLIYTIESIMQQTSPVRDIYILDDLSTDNTQKVCKELSSKYEKVNHVRRDVKGGKAGNINAIIKDRGKELGDYILVVDGDVELEKDCLEQFLTSSEEGPVVTGFGYTRKPNSPVAEMLYEGETWINSVFSFRKKAQVKRNSVFVVCGALSLYKKEILEKYPIPTRTLTEDTDLTWLLQENGFQIMYNDKARGRGGNPDSLKGYWNRYVRWFSGTFQNIYVHGIKDLKKSKPLLYSTIIPGLIEVIPYSIITTSLPVVAYFYPDLAKGVILADVALSTPFLFMHPKGFLYGVMRLPDIYAFKYFGSVVALYAGAKTTLEKIMGKESSWKNTWESTSR